MLLLNIPCILLLFSTHGVPIYIGIERRIQDLLRQELSLQT